jgi:mannosyltransferase
VFRARQLEASVLAGVVAVAAAAFLWHLGSSSLFGDETYSWRAAVAPLSSVVHAVRATEVAPPAYYLLLHFWIHTIGVDSVWGMRLLSVFAALGFVAGVWWLGRLVKSRTAGLLAALLAALAPLAVQYAQEIRAYAFVMATATLAVAAAVQATRQGSRQGLWLGFSLVAAVLTIWLHYTGVLVVLVLLAFVLSAPAIPRIWRRGYATVCGLAFLAVVPLMVHQLEAQHGGGVAQFAQPTMTNFLRVIGTPFDGHFRPRALSYVTGALVVVVALAWNLRPSAAHRRDRRLVVAAGIAPVLTIALITVVAALVGKSDHYTLLSRYSAVGAGFLLVAIALALIELPRPASLALAAIVVTSIVSGLSATYSTLWPNLRDPFGTIADRYRPGDAVILVGYAGQPVIADYYVTGLDRQHPHLSVTWLSPGSPALARLFSGAPPVPKSDSRLWIVSDIASLRQALSGLGRGGWHPVANTLFRPGIELTLAER